jgi:hypothetical protein
MARPPAARKMAVRKSRRGFGGKTIEKMKKTAAARKV